MRDENDMTSFIVEVLQVPRVPGWSSSDYVNKFRFFVSYHDYYGASGSAGLSTL